MNADPRHGAQVASLEQWRAGRSRDDPASVQLLDSAWQSARAKVSPEIPLVRPIPTPYRVAPRPLPWWIEHRTAVWYGGGVLVVALIVFFVVGTTRHWLPWLRGREYVTSTSQQLSVTLSDGTRFTLAPSSRVRVHADYGRDTRELDLEGEAYFTVIHDTSHPFTVHARSASVQDIGTAFDVRAYPHDSTVRVAVTEGRVDVESINAEFAPPEWVSAGDIAIVSDTAVEVTHAASVTPLIAWTSGQLVFDHTPLREVADALKRWYGVSVTFGSPLITHRTYSATFDHEPVTEVIDALSAATHTRYEKRPDGTYVLYPADSTATPAAPVSK